MHLESWFVHVEWTCQNCGIMRLFSKPVGKFDKDGQPIKSWEYTFTIIREGDTAVMKAALNLPKDAKVPIGNELKRLGFKFVEWERWKARKIKKRWAL